MKNTILGHRIHEIPLNLITVLPQEDSEFTEIPLYLWDKRKYSELAVRRKIKKIGPFFSNEIPLETRVIKNGLFKLTIPSDFSLISCQLYIDHPELSNKFKYYISSSGEKNGDLIKLISKCRNVFSGVLAGNYYFDPKTNFFELDDKEDDVLQERIVFGNHLCNKEKLSPGSRYAIETSENFGCRDLIFLGEVSNIILPKLDKSSYLYYPLLNQMLEFDLNLDICLYKDPINLFKDEFNQYYLIPKKFSKTGGLIERDVEKEITCDEFHNMCVQNDWWFGLDCRNNKDQLMGLIRNKVIETLTSPPTTLGRLTKLLDINIRWWGSIDLSKYTSTEMINALTKVDDISVYYDTKDSFILSLIFRKDLFDSISDDEIREFYRDIWLNCFGKE